MKMRTTVLLQTPGTYSISGCKCGNQNTQWSEFEAHLWCDKCNIDFIPEDSGILDGTPFGVHTAELMGIRLDRMVLATQQIEVLDSQCVYTPCLDENTEEIPVILKGAGDMMLEGIIDKNNELHTTQTPTCEAYTTEFVFGYPQKHKFFLVWKCEAGVFSLEKTSDYKTFKQFRLEKLKEKLDNNLVTNPNNKKSKI